MSLSLLENITVVLVEPTHPGNIGAAARAMKTMGLTRLRLVRPQRFPSAEATARASGADDVLFEAVVTDTLPAALEGATLVLGASARGREIEWPELGPKGCAEQAIREAYTGHVVLVFGREHAGLTNAELDRCHYLVRIPSNPAFSSLNLAAAVQLLAYELHMAAGDLGGQAPAGLADGRWATADEVERLFAHLEQALVQTGFLEPQQPKRLMRRLRRLFNRTRLDSTEVHLLRGILRSVQHSIATARPAPRHRDG